MATTLSDVLAGVAVAIGSVGTGGGDARGLGWTRLSDATATRFQPGGYRLLAPSADRDPEFGVDGTETLSATVTAEFCRAGDVAEDAAFFAELSILANAIERGNYPAGTVAVIARGRAVSRQYADPAWITGTIALQVKWEQAF